MLLPDQTYEQANLRQERLRVRSSTAFDDDDHGEDRGFQRLLELRGLDVKRLQAEQEVSSDRVLANNEMKFGGSGEDGSGSSGVGSSTDGPRNGKHQEVLDVRLPMSMTNGGKHVVDFDGDSLWSGGRVHHNGRVDAGSHTMDVRSRSRSSQRAPPTCVYAEPKQSRSDQTDRGIGLGSTSSVGSSGLSYSSDSCDEEDNRFGPEDVSRKASSLQKKRINPDRREGSLSPPKVPDGESWAPDHGERDDYDKTSDFFNNIPEFHGEALGPFSLADKRTEPDWGSIRTNVDILRACELFLMRHRMRPDFFCKYTKAMNPSASAPASFPLSRSRTPIDDPRKPKSVSPPMQRPASRAHGSASFSRTSMTLAAEGRSPPGDRGPGPIYSVPNRAGKKRRPNAAIVSV
ncbi:uncharacterized protein LOC131293118 [Anopheles ziemanni]|uniref:uncharacterized protein LOC131264039 n=1 Tax=Anopheles coustani TaxID=139045 RepID=UPI00265929A4|nr:uncharacterized protein LOC131264039 [Anopheles coustani]XP_058177178.1 uncharacterized protein LOC131293118 [Anopheles ziemanni]